MTTEDNKALDSCRVPNVAVVAIGRNEGERLKACIRSLTPQSACVVYVDSGSTDGSCDAAVELGANVVNLDMTKPFTAARARNAGFRRVMELNPDTFAIMFTDGDCVIDESFIRIANESLMNEDRLAVVVGRLREQNPEVSIYNRLCDTEWIKPVGLISECGGNALIRASAFNEMNGYREDIIAGEEPELCVRLTSGGWKIRCIDVDMGLHDARLTRFSQWWKRSVRCGHAYAEGVDLHGKGPHRHYVSQLRSVRFWGILVPLLAVTSLFLATINPRIGLGFLLWPIGWLLLVVKVFRYRKTQGDQNQHAWLYAIFCVLAKLPNGLGTIKYRWHQVIGKKSSIIEY